MKIQRVAPIDNPVVINSPLFEDLSELELNAVAAFLEPHWISRGETLFEEGSDGDCIYILLSGTINALVNQADRSRRLMFNIKPGDFFGEMSIIANESRSATLVAKTDADLLVFNGFDFFRFVFEYPIIGVKLLKAIRKTQNIWLDQTSRHLGDLMRWGETARRRAVCDELTGLYNRRFLEESAKDRFKQGSLNLRNVSLIMMDLDRIHEVNNNHGIKAGDMVFISTADILRTTTRPGDICARLSGDEFAILLPETKSEEAFSIAERIRRTMSVRKVDVSEKTKVIVNTSIGIACAPVHADNWKNLYIAADNALQRAKELGRNRIETAK